MTKVLKDKTTKETLIAEIKAMICETTMKTGEFVQAIIEDAGEKRATSIKSPKALVDMWAKRELALGSLRYHAKRVRAKAPVKLAKVKAAKSGKGCKVKAAAAAPMLMIASDQLMLPLVYAA